MRLVFIDLFYSGCILLCFIRMCWVVRWCLFRFRSASSC
ncbi:unnamed protein product [Brassica oleracea var. botrytis]|uniref:(rape) hypothetical protein n=1 Tax=Brassica napus TaxID=3708 RepID=A0A816US18_BRANA|nr:unnamed protein product [Brassica napus]